MEHKHEHIGTSPEGYEVNVATDSIGAQVIVIDKAVDKVDTTPATHLLSQPQKDHQAAVELGERVVAEGVDVYSDWLNLKMSGMDLFNLAMGLLTGNDKQMEQACEGLFKDQ